MRVTYQSFRHSHIFGKSLERRQVITLCRHRIYLTEHLVRDKDLCTGVASGALRLLSRIHGICEKRILQMLVSNCPIICPIIPRQVGPRIPMNVLCCRINGPRSILMANLPNLRQVFRGYATGFTSCCSTNHNMRVTLQKNPLHKHLTSILVHSTGSNHCRNDRLFSSFKYPTREEVRVQAHIVLTIKWWVTVITAPLKTVFCYHRTNHRIEFIPSRWLNIQSTDIHLVVVKNHSSTRHPINNIPVCIQHGSFLL